LSRIEPRRTGCEPLPRAQNCLRSRAPASATINGHLRCNAGQGRSARSAPWPEGDCRGGEAPMGRDPGSEGGAEKDSAQGARRCSVHEARRDGAPNQRGGANGDGGSREAAVGGGEIGTCRQEKRSEQSCLGAKGLAQQIEQIAGCSPPKRNRVWMTIPNGPGIRTHGRKQLASHRQRVDTLL